MQYVFRVILYFFRRHYISNITMANFRLHIHSLRLVFTLLVVLSSLPQTVSAADHSEYYRGLMNMPSSELYKKGKYYADRDRCSDSALVCFTILADRYDKNGNKEDNKLCAQAYANTCFVYFFDYFNYSKAFENMVKAQKISEEIGVEIPDVYLNFGLMYCSIGEQSQDRKTTLLALSYLKKAFYAAYKSNNGMVMNTAFSNMISQTYKQNMFDYIAKEWHIFYNYKRNNSKKEYTEFNILLYRGVSCIVKRQYNEAIKQFDKQIAMMPLDNNHVRYICGSWEYKAHIYALQKRYDDAIHCMKELERLATRFNIKDARIEIYRTMADYYSKLGMPDKTNAYRAQFLSLKDTLLNYQQVATMDEIKFLNEMRKVDEQMDEIKQKRQRQEMISIIVGFVSLIILLSIFVIYRKNRQLRKTNESLYKKNVEILNSEEQERKLRKDYKQQLDEMHNILKNEQPDNTESKAELPKYKNSNLNEENKNELITRILSVMENTPEIYSVDFSAERLATLIDSKYKYVSQVINETYQCNFNTFLNNFRIKEACKRINDIKTYGNFTIEALSVGVGFKSRSTFVIQFKRVTGLTPSEYQSIARKA